MKLHRRCSSFSVEFIINQNMIVLIGMDEENESNSGEQKQLPPRLHL
jgi:hypothetical protein